MAQQPRRSAPDVPALSAIVNLSRQLLGRSYKPDPRDWTLERVLTLTVGAAEPDDSILGMRLEDAIAQTPYADSCRSRDE